jgi:hypothetical protein
VHELTKNKEEWDALSPKLDKKGRIIEFQSAVGTIFSLGELMTLYWGVQYNGSDELTETQRDALDGYKGRVGKGGIILEKSSRQLVGRRM